MFMKMRSLILAAIIVAAGASSAWAWSSVRMAGDAFATHEFLNEEAYRELSKHPAFKYNEFPTLEEIQDHAGVNADKTGNGPDNGLNSKFSYHWYNPNTKKGGAPGVAQDYATRLTFLLKKERPPKK